MFCTESFREMNIRNSPEMIQKCVAAVQNLCDACVEIRKLQTTATESHQCTLDTLILEMEELRLKQEPTQEEVNSVIRKLNGHL